MILPATRTNPAAKLAMQNAWRIAREDQSIYGGSPRSYIAEALRIAWAELKADPVFVAVNQIIAELQAERRQPRPDPAAGLSPGLLAAAGRMQHRHGARAYGSGLGSARCTAGW